MIHSIVVGLIGVAAFGVIGFTLIRLRKWTEENIARERESQAALREELKRQLLQVIQDERRAGRSIPCIVLQNTFVDKRVLTVYLGAHELPRDARADVVLHTDIADLLGALLTAQRFRIEPGCEPRLTNQ